MHEAVSSVLFVCRQNICRSIAAEGVFRYLVTGTGLKISADSAGVQALPDCLPDPAMCSVAALRGYDLSGLRSRMFFPDDFQSFDLILALSRDNLEAVQAQAPADAKARTGLLMDYSQEFGTCEAGVPFSERGYGLLLDHVEDACLGLYHHLADEPSGSSP